MPMEWVGPLISGAAVVLVAIIEAVAARERKRVKRTTRRSTPSYTVCGLC